MIPCLMNGLGNTFWVFDARQAPFDISCLQDITCDQILVISPSPIADCFMRVFNRDGSEVSACGNGTRCISLFLGGTSHTIQTNNRILSTVNHENGLVSVNMGTPSKDCYGFAWGESVKLEPNIKGFVLDVGNPHFMCLNQDPSEQIGSFIQNNPLFTEKINVNFIKILDNNSIFLKTFERGVGFTKACGTGACASTFILHHLELTHNQIRVHLDIGHLDISINEHNEIIMCGDASFDC